MSPLLLHYFQRMSQLSNLFIGKPERAVKVRMLPRDIASVGTNDDLGTSSADAAGGRNRTSIEGRMFHSFDLNRVLHLALLVGAEARNVPLE